jgi:hypothetical protein
VVSPTRTRVAETNTRVVQTVRLMDGDSPEQNTANSPQSSGARSYSSFKGSFPCTPNAWLSRFQSSPNGGSSKQEC